MLAEVYIMVKANLMIRRRQNKVVIRSFTLVHNADNRRWLRLYTSWA